MKKLSKLLSVLILTLLVGVTVFAVGTFEQTNLKVGSHEEAQKTTSTLITPSGSNACNSNVGFSARKTLRMSLVKLDQPFDFELESEAFTYAKAVQRYGSSYYVTCPEEALYYPVSGSNPTRTNRDKPVVLYSGDNTAKFPTCGKVFASIMNDMADNDVVKTSPISGAKYITPESGVLTQLVTELSQLGEYNYQLAQEYFDSQSNDELAKTPIAVCIEVVGVESIGTFTVPADWTEEYRKNIEAYGCTVLDWQVTKYFGHDAIYGVDMCPGNDIFSGRRVIYLIQTRSLHS